MNQTKPNKNSDPDLTAGSGFVKLYAHGKLGLVFHGDHQFIKIAEQCFTKSIRVTLNFDRQKFELEMRNRGIPTEVINRFADGYSLNDDIWLSTGSNWPN